MKFTALFLTICVSLPVFAGKVLESDKQRMEERTEEIGADMGRGVKKASRKVEDETCELVNGKMQCLGKKTKHSIQNGADRIEDAID